MTDFLEGIRHTWLCKERKTLCAEVTTNLLSEIVKARHGGSCRTWWDLEAGASRVQVIFPCIASSILGCARTWLEKKTRNCKGGNRILCYKTELQFTLKWTCGHLKLQSDCHSSSQVLVIHPIWSWHITSYHKMGEDNTVLYILRDHSMAIPPWIHLISSDLSS